MLRAAIAAVFAAAVGVAPAAAGPGFFVGLTEDQHATLRDATPYAQDLGLKAYRVPLWWPRGQARVDPLNVAGLDEVVRAAPSSVRLVVALASHKEETPLTVQDREDYCSFARDILARYPRINDIVVWNEPNKTDFWAPQYNADETSAAPGAYVALLARCYDVLHAFRPNVNVIAPATSPRGNDRPQAVSNISHSPVRFIHGMGEAYRASGRTTRLFDTFAHHAYGSQPHERPWRTHGTTQISQGDWQKLMTAVSYAFEGTGQPVPGECERGRCVWIWYTEHGFQTIPDEAKAGLYSEEENFVPVPDFVGGEPEAPPPDVTTRGPDQATQIQDAVRLAACQPYVQAFFNYRLVDSPSLVGWQSGFLWADWTPKDSYQAFKGVIAQANAKAVPCGALKSGPIPLVDPAPPAPPARPTIRLVRRQVTLDWPDAPEDDVMGYAVFRGPRGGGPYMRLNRSGLTPTSKLVDRGLRRGRTYCYRVVAFDTVENRSAQSRPRCVAVPRRR